MIILINMSKTKVLVFNTTRSGHKFYINNQMILEANHYTYLGIHFKKDGSLDLAMKILNNKALKANFAIKQGFYNASAKVSLKLFDSLVKPICLYGSEIWALDVIDWNKNIEQLLSQDNLPFEKLHIRFCKSILKVNSKCCNISAKSELGRFPIITSILVSMVKYWKHARESNKNSLIYMATNNDLVSKIVNYQNIVDKIIGKSLNFDDIAIDTINKEIFTLKKSLKDSFTKEFFKKINVTNDCSSKFREYNKVKKIYRLENYLESNDPNRQYISKIRLSCHHFPIEIGRWKKIDKSKRLCFFCNSDNTIGDEFHVLFQCSYQPIVEERTTFIDKLNQCNNQFSMFDSNSLYLYTLLCHDKAVSKITSVYFKKLCNIAYASFKNMSSPEMALWIQKCTNAF